MADGSADTDLVGVSYVPSVILLELSQCSVVMVPSVPRKIQRFKDKALSQAQKPSLKQTFCPHHT